MLVLINVSIFIVALLICLIALGAFLTIVLFFYNSKLHLKKAYNNASNLIFFKITVPEDNETEVKAFEQFYISLLGIKEKGKFNTNKSPHLSLEIVGDENGINFYVICPKKIRTLVEKSIHSVYSDAEISVSDKNIWSIWESEGHQEFKELYLSKEDYFPINTYEEVDLEPLNAITSAMSKMNTGEAVAMQLLIRPAVGHWKKLGNSLAGYLLNKKDKDGNPKTSDKDREKAETIKQKTENEGYEFILRIMAVAPDKDTAKNNLSNLKNALNIFDNPKGNKFSSKKIKDYPFLSNSKRFVYAFVFRVFPFFHVELPYLNKIVVKGYSVLNTKELATIFHFPNNKVKTPGINWLRSRSNISPSLLPTTGTYIGISEFRGSEKKIYIDNDDRRRHMYVVGQTGTGKSELLKFLAVQDIKDGKGVAFIDPHGSAVSDILLQIPQERIKDVIYFNPGDEMYPMGFNILDAKGAKAQNLVVNSFIELLYKLYDPQHQGIVGPQLERAVRNAMLTVMEVVPGGTMVDVMRLIIDQKYEKELAAKVTDPLVKKYWTDEMANTQAFHRSEKTGYFVSKFDRFVTDRTMRNIMGQPKSSFDLAEVMKQKKILLVDLNKGLMGEENSKFLGLLLIPRLLSAAFNRPAYEGNNFDDFFLYVDEFQNFATPDFVTILSEARKYKLNLVMANQFLAQMTEEIRTAIFGNVGTLVSFRVGQDDGRYLSEQFSPFYKESDIINQQVGRAIIKLLVNGHPTIPFSLKTDWQAISNATRSEQVKDEVIEYTRRNYSAKLEDVEKVIADKMGLNDPQPQAPASPFGAGAMPGGASPFMPFPRPASPYGMPVDPNKPFSSGQTPFSQGSQTPPRTASGGFMPMPPMPMPINPMYPRPVMPSYPSTFPPAPVPLNNSQQGSNVSKSNLTGVKPGGAENKDAASPNQNTQNQQGYRPPINPFSMPLSPYTRGGAFPVSPVYNPRPLADDNQQQDSPNPKRGTISLANLHNQPKNPVSYSTPQNTFKNTSGQTPPPVPNFNGPMDVQNPEKKDKTEPPVKDDTVL